MLASKNRLKKKVNFARIEIDGTMIQSKSFGMGIYNRNDSDPSRFGFIISTKISKKAVIRNKLKRIMSDAVRLCLNRTKNGYDVLFLVKPHVLKTSRIELEKEVYETTIKNI